jgi:hypothetical protein
MPEGKTRIALLGVLAGLVAAVSGVLARRRRRSVSSTPVAGHAVASSAADQSVTCACGREYRTRGAGRHRVYWPAGAPENGAVLGDTCPSCGEPLPVPSEGAAA